MNIKSLLIAAALTTALAGTAQASLTTIGTANYNSSTYNLIYDSDSSLIWLDYSNAGNTWGNQVAWASGLGSTLSNVKLNSGVSVTWNSGWRLPTTIDGPMTYSYNGSTSFGYNNTTSEFGHLYYTELQNKAPLDKNGNVQAGYGLVNKGPFAYLQSSGYYWSETEYAIDPNRAWGFLTADGSQYPNINGLGLAVRSGIVTLDATPTPIPAAAWLFGSGLMGLAGVRRRVKK
jgi:hypothetical protein